MSADAKDDGKSPPVPPRPPREALAGAPAAPARKPAPALPPAIGATLPPLKLPAAPPKPAGGPPKLVAPPPARAISLPPPATTAVQRPAPAPLAAPLAPAGMPAAQNPAQAHPPSTPPLEIPMTAAELDARASRSTMDFLFELDSSRNPPTSGEMDLGTMPEVRAAIAASDAVTRPATIEVQARISMPELPIESVPPPSMASNDGATAVDIDPLSSTPLSIPRIPMRSQPPANTAQEQLEARRRRIIARLVTCRDVFRALGYLDIKEADRTEVARLLMGLDDVLDPARRNLGIAKDPAAVLAGATKDEIDRIERLISPIEDKLLQLDDLVQDAQLAARVDNGKITPKMLARYGRLLASRRIQAGPRRDRFEWIATALLSRKTKDGRRALVGAERATETLELLIAGLPFKPKEQELEEAIVYLTDALERLSTFEDQAAFFASDFFIDVHGYKVSMRELILSPDFVYLSVAINVRLHNRVEQWIALMEQAPPKPNQLMQDRSPRDHMTRRLRQAEDAVGSIFNVKPRGVAAASRIDSNASPADQKSSLKPRGSKKPAPESSSGAWRVVLLLLLLAALGAGGYLAHQRGLIQIDALRHLLE